MSTQAKNIFFGGDQTGLAHVGYTLLDPTQIVSGAFPVLAARTEAGVIEVGGGGYAALITSAVACLIKWDNGATTPLVAMNSFDLPVSGGSGGLTTGQAAQITDIQTQVDKLLFDGSGNLLANVSGYAAGKDPATLLFGAMLDGNLTLKQAMLLQTQACLEADRNFNASTHTAVVTWYRRAAGANTADKTKPLLVKTTVYDAVNVEVVSNTVTLSNLP